jgi:cysteinyl-tRNA synthetase
MASIWMHNGFLQVEGQKMSKSLGNFVTIAEVLKDWPGEVARLAMLKTHYRQPIDWTVKSLEEAEKELNSWYDALDTYGTHEAEPDRDFVERLGDDLNIAEALTRLRAIARWTWGVSIGKSIQNVQNFGGSNGASILRATANLIGLLQHKPVDWEAKKLKANFDPNMVTSLVNARRAARAAKNWVESDRIRDELVAMGIQLMDGKDADGNPLTTWEVKR